MKIVAHCGDSTFMVLSKGKCYLVRTRTKKVFDIDYPDSIYRQGYWEEGGEVSEEKREEISSLIP